MDFGLPLERLIAVVHPVVRVGSLQRPVSVRRTPFPVRLIRRRRPWVLVLYNLNEIIMESLQFTRLERREHRVTILFRPNPDLPRVQTDRVQITQVLVNLFSNAIQAIKKGNHPVRKSWFPRISGTASLVRTANQGPVGACL